MGNRGSVLIVSQHRIFRECLAQSLEGLLAFKCSCATCIEDALASIAAESTALAIIDHGGMSEETILGFLVRGRRECPDCRFLVLGSRESEQQLTRYIEAGAAGFVVQDRSQQELIAAIESVVQHNADCSPEQASLVFSRLQQLSRRVDSTPGPGPSELTNRELEILRLIDLGRSNKEIARELHLSVHTVKTHVHNILEKAGAANRRQAVYLANNNGWLQKQH